MNTKKYIALSLMVATLGFFNQCAEEFDSPATIEGATLVNLAASDTTLEIFTAAMVKTGIGISLDNINSGQHTVFAPTDSAFRIYFQPIIGGGPGDIAIITFLNSLSTTTTPSLATFTSRLQYHIVSSEAKAADIANSKVFTSINGARLSLSKVPGMGVYVNGNNSSNGARVRHADIDGANGVIHTVSRFMSAISVASVITTTGDADALGITVNYAKSPIESSVNAAGTNHNIFATAVVKTGLAPTLRPNVATAALPDFTIFCPTDAAMVTYLKDVLLVPSVTDEASGLTYIKGLTKSNPDSATIASIVRYHITTGRVLTTDVADNQEILTLLSGKTIKVFDAAPSVILEDAKSGTGQATISNTKLSNAGILHKIGSVLLPQ